MDLGIKGRTALITGAVGGIGESTAERLAEAGCTLILSDLKEETLNQAADRIRSSFPDAEVHTAPADLSSPEGAKALKDSIDTHVDILVHTTGITGEKGMPLEISHKGWEDALHLDFLSGVWIAQQFVPAMGDKGWGRVVYIGSENVTQPYVDESCYNASKAALMSFAKSLSITEGKRGVLVNSVAPAFIETDMTDGMMKMRSEQLGVSKEEAVKSFLKEERPHLVLERRGQKHEVSSVIAFLVSELSSFVVGSVWRVDGGAVLAVDF